MNGAFFEIRELSCSIAGSRILDRVSFLVQRGDCVCIVGPNGAGKSTLLKCAGGLIRNFSGQALLEGAPLLSLKSRLVARRVAWVHQTGADSLPFTVREFARMCRDFGDQAYMIMEGHIYTPEDAIKCLYLGAHSVVVGSAITRPHLTAKRFVDLMDGYRTNWRDAEKSKH